MKIYGEINYYNPLTGIGKIIDEQNNEYWFLLHNVINYARKNPAGKVLFNINIRDDNEVVPEAFNVELL